MTKVTVESRAVPQAPVMESEIRVQFAERGSGTTSEISWQNASTMQGLRAMFQANSDEIILAIVVTKNGIRAEFGRKE